MSMLNSKKGGIGVAILVAVIAVAIVFGGILYFFFVFKAHATLVARDEYIWNKVQELPLSLLSMDVGEESFVSRMNKVYYELADKDLLKDETSDVISKQLFYWLEGPEYPFEFVIILAQTRVPQRPKVLIVGLEALVD